MKKTPKRGLAFSTVAFMIMIAIGAGAFAAGMRGWHTARIWQAYLVNFVFWTGLAYGGIFFVALSNLTNAKFGRPMKRLAEAMGAFLPIAFLLFIGLYWGREAIFPWLHETIPHKQAWLNIRLLFWREGAGFVILSITAMILMTASMKSDRRFAAKSGSAADADAGAILLQEARRHLLWRLQVLLSPLFCILYVFILTMFSWDFIMMLSTDWYSTLFGPYFFIGCFYSSIAALFIISLLVYRNSTLSAYIGKSNFHSLGKFMLAFLLVTGDFFFSQYLLMWYGNLPDETRFLITRLYTAPWKFLSWTVASMIFIVPFVVLLFRRSKTSMGVMLILSPLVLIGMWLERFLLIAPSLRPAGMLPLGIEEALVSIGFLGLMGISILCYLRLGPWVPSGDPVFIEHYQLEPTASH
jgi:Ni/Fe-hydrogenase subunit HybB-like protein